MKYDWNLERIKEIIPQCINFTEVLKMLSIPRQGNNSNTLKRLLDENNIDYSHFTGRARVYNNTSTSISEYLSNRVKITSGKLRIKLLTEGLKENKCEICGVSIWQGVQLPLELHHKDGDHFNNDFDNLQILCPNCHSIQEGNAGANAGKYVKMGE